MAPDHGVGLARAIADGVGHAGGLVARTHPPGIDLVGETRRGGGPAVAAPAGLVGVEIIGPIVLGVAPGLPGAAAAGAGV